MKNIFDKKMYYYPTIGVIKRDLIEEAFKNLYSSLQMNCSKIECEGGRWKLKVESETVEWVEALTSINGVVQLSSSDHHLIGVPLSIKESSPICYTYGNGFIEGAIEHIYLCYFSKLNDYQQLQILMKIPNFKTALKEISKKEGHQVIPYANQSKIFKNWTSKIESTAGMNRTPNQ